MILEEKAIRESLVYRGIPPHMHEAVVAYLLDGRPVGDFLTALFEDSLMRTFNCADSKNILAIDSWVRWLYNDAPGPCHGSPEKVRAWIAWFAETRRREKVREEKS